jgi:hypothetical protein
MVRSEFCGLIVFALASAFGTKGGCAAELSVDDLLGKWCGPTIDYVFTRERLTVLPHDGSAPRVLPIRKFALNSGEGSIKVYWDIKRRDLVEEDISTVFYEFDPDHHNMAQQANTTGDKGARRAFHRC